jgi:hypothetical protein
MTDKKNLNLITTDCGQQYVIDFLDQVALGIIDSAEYTGNSLFIPPTFSLYKTVSGEYLLEITQFNTTTHLLETSYKLIDEREATPFLENGTLNVLLH